jgi:prepilin-type N-terminal cleavage/methylation domain-containing protein
MRSRRGFTLIELLMVVAIIGIVMSLVGLRMGTFTFWREEGFIRRLSETIIFLHHQAVVDQEFYRIDFDFERNQYQVGTLITEGQDNTALSNLASSEGIGNLSLEIAAFKSPSIGTSQTLVPPASMPSLAEPIPLPEDAVFEDVRTMRGLQNKNLDGQGAYVLFSPRGFSEFAVIHLRLKGGRPVTILVNPFTGLTDIYREYKDFEWTYGQNKNDK